jgi:hypothetical protein
MQVNRVIGVDFSGARLAGRNIWLAEAGVTPAGLVLRSLDRLSDLAGAAEREVCLPWLVDHLVASRDTVIGMDFPFGLPVELPGMGATWEQQLAFVSSWAGDAKLFGHWCVDASRKLDGRLHIRRLTDRETATPFDCYHYRIIYQTFHGMRDVLRPMYEHANVLPFHRRNRAGRATVMETCPSSTLKRLRLPHRNYKQSGDRPPTEQHRATRRSILGGVRKFIQISPAMVRRMMANPGGDALDAVIAAVGTWQAYTTADHAAIAVHPRYSIEGRVYA